MNLPHCSQFPQRFSTQFADAVVSNHLINTEDGVQLQLHRICRRAGTPAVLLLHGLSSSSAMFSGAEWYNLTAYLLDHGYHDIWLLDWRGSALYHKRYLSAGHDIDDVVEIDLPQAVAQMRAAIGAQPIHIISHCIGAMALSMALANQTITGIKSAICANVGLFPTLAAASLVKLLSVPGLAHHVFDIEHLLVDANDSDYQTSEALPLLLSHSGQNQCANVTCRMLSFVWGAGHESTIFKHRHLHPDTHSNLHHYFGPVSLSYFFHIQKMLHHAAVVGNQAKGRAALNYLDQVARIITPMLLCVGSENRVWHDSIQQYYRIIRQYHPNLPVQLLEVPGYTHNDVFMGVDAHVDVFPALLKFLQSQQ